MRKVILSADSTCDLSRELLDKYQVNLFCYHIQLDGKDYTDTVDITPDDIYETWYQKGVLPKTAAITPFDYIEHFEKWVEDGYDVVHLNLGSALSSSYSNCCTAAEDIGHIYPVDSKSLSTGMGLLVIKAGEMIKEGKSAAEIQSALNEMTQKVHASFVLDTLEFLKAGGRCSSLTALSAHLLNIKPCIEVFPEDDGKMNVGKKYRGSVEKVLKKYVQDKLSTYDNLDKSCIFITHSGSPESDIELVKKELESLESFKQIYITRAGSTISTHCGPRTLGILFMTK